MSVTRSISSEPIGKLYPKGACAPVGIHPQSLAKIHGLKLKSLPITIHRPLNGNAGHQMYVNPSNIVNSNQSFIAFGSHY